MIIKIKIILSPAEVSISVQQKFTGFKTVPPPMNVKAFNDMQEKVASTYTYAADGSMKNAANEFISAQGQGNENIEDDVADMCVSKLAETWSLIFKWCC